MSKVILRLAAFFLFIFAILSGSFTVSFRTVVDTRQQGKLDGFEVVDTVIVEELTDFNTSDELKIYIGDKGPVVPYVDLNDFFNFLSPAINRLQVFEIEFNKHLWQARLNKKQRIQIDFNKHQLIIDDLMFLDDVSSFYTSYLNKRNPLGYKEEVINRSNQIVIDLDDYDINIINENGYYLVPFYFANFLLSGYDLDVSHYYNNFGHYVFVETPSNYFNRQVSPFFSQMKVLLEPEHLLLIENETLNFIKFIFENFYGLKAQRTINIDNFETIEQPMSVVDFQSKMNQFIYGLDDLHTSFIYQSHLNRNYNSLDHQISSYYINYYSQYQKSQCLNAKNQLVDYYHRDGILYIEIFGFEDELEDELDKIMKVYVDEDTSDVYFDIRCNSGGYISYIQHIIKYMTDQPWSLVVEDVSSGKRAWHFNASNRYFLKDVNFYLVTSGYTYSAANSLTALVKDMKLATIIGSESSGGAASIDVLSLPDGSVIGISSPFHIFSVYGNSQIELGIEPDIKVDFLKLANLNSELKNIDDYESFFKGNIARNREEIYPRDYQSYTDFIERIIEYGKRGSLK